MATAATAAAGASTRPLRRVYRAARAGSGLQRRRALPRATGFGFHRRLDAGAAFRQAVSRAAPMVGVGDGALRDRAGRTGSSRLWPAPGLDRRAAGEGSSVRDDARLFAPAVCSRLSPRTADQFNRRPRARVSLVWRGDPDLPVR